MATIFTYTNYKLYKIANSDLNRKDTLIIVLIIGVISITAWNSRYQLIPTPSGYTRYAEHGIVFLYPEDLYLWEVFLLEDGYYDASIPISEENGLVGWNSGNTDQPQPSITNWKESSVLWLETEPPEEYTLHLFYDHLVVRTESWNYGITLSKGEIHDTTHMNHEVIIQFFNYTTHHDDPEENSHVFGVIGGYYCDKTQRIVEVYYLDIYDKDLVYDRDSLLNEFNFILESLHCH